MNYKTLNEYATDIIFEGKSDIEKLSGDWDASDFTSAINDGIIHHKRWGSSDIEVYEHGRGCYITIDDLSASEVNIFKEYLIEIKSTLMKSTGKTMNVVHDLKKPAILTITYY